ncbi:protease [Youhaiella tibetensis]|uniref:S49 family peptidase n=1 Tax=Paradevosia tibetensis TaxID=1447062 RepID=A0A5B9DL64_9HYPH|nr:S49 family peptidase [Youhaiella tibetensis]QEE19645.1 S49 family peptidase [Youhaiella tibetensis]GGF31249.1 protease [Youhaiella tibetensis]
MAGRIRSWIGKLFGHGATVIPVVRLQGVIAADTRPGRLNIAGVAPLLKRAFDMKAAPVVAIIVNSPGGSAVQSRLISKRIRDLAEETGKKVIVFVEDAAASGGYFIAVGADEIIADPSSIVGSIGVISAGFGFVEAIEKLGVTRRVYTAGKNKSTLDPFLPEKREDVDRLNAFALDVHHVFIDHVKTRRAGKLTAPDDELFTGQWWSALSGLRLGLIDGLGDIHQTLRERYGADVQLKAIEPKRPLFALPRFGLSAAAAGSATGEVLASIEDRALWSRFGL